MKNGVKGEAGYSEWRTVAIEDSGGVSEYIASIQNVRADTPGGLALTAEGKIAGFRSLTKASDVERSAFDGEDYVVVEGLRTPIAEKVQDYNEDNGTWIDLAAAKGYSDTMEVYYSGTLGADAKVRVITVGGR